MEVDKKENRIQNFQITKRKTNIKKKIGYVQQKAGNKK